MTAPRESTESGTLPRRCARAYGVPRVLVSDATDAAALERATIDAGTPARALMQRAGAAAAAYLGEHCGEAIARGVLVVTGPGNNGGDGWVAAASLARAGARVTVCEIDAPRTDDARFERARALPHLTVGDLGAPPPAGLVVDAVLGTGARGAVRGRAAEAVALMTRLRQSGATVAALDLPTGVDASSGAAEGALRADVTVTFGSMKRGLLAARGHAGRIAVLDIGLEAPPDSLGNATIVDARWVSEALPVIPANAHKGLRGRVAVVGGARGLVGATTFTAHGAAASGAGVVRLVVAAESIAAAQVVCPHAITDAWPADAAAAQALASSITVLVMGPGLGRGADARALAERVLAAWRGPTVLDADALTVFEGEADALARHLDGRPAVITPHLLEFARLAGGTPADAAADPYTAARRLAARLGCVVLLKGVPTVVAAPDGRVLVSAAGTPALGAGGSGDLLAGIVGTLLGQSGDALTSAAAAAWAHGRAAEIAGAGRPLRGVTLDHVLDSLSLAWPTAMPPARPPVLLELPAVPEV